MRTGQILRIAPLLLLLAGNAFAQTVPAAGAPAPETGPSSLQTDPSPPQSSQTAADTKPAPQAPAPSSGLGEPTAAQAVVSGAPSENTGGEAPKANSKAPSSPNVPETLRGHFRVGLGGSFIVPFGLLTTDVPAFETLGVGPGLQLDLEYGLSETVSIGIWGQAGSFKGGMDCNGAPATEPHCRTSTVAGGLAVAYHLVQGLRFDPWLSAGVGYRVTRTQVNSSVDYTYAAPGMLRLAVGGDWYALRNLGIGPWLELNGNVHTEHPSVSPVHPTIDDQKPRLSLLAIAGIRVLFDFPGR